VSSLATLTAQPFDSADSPRELDHTQSPGKQQISLNATNVHKNIKWVQLTLNNEE